MPVTFPATVNLSEVCAARFASRVTVPPPAKFPPSAMVRMEPSAKDAVAPALRFRFSKFRTTPETVDVPPWKASVSVPAPPSIIDAAALPLASVIVSEPPSNVTEPPVICPETVIVSLPVPAVTEPFTSALDAMLSRSPKKRGSDTEPGPAGKSIAMLLAAVPTVAPLISMTEPTVPPENFSAAPEPPLTDPVIVTRASPTGVFFTYIPWRPPLAEAALIASRGTPFVEVLIARMPSDVAAPVPETDPVVLMEIPPRDSLVACTPWPSAPVTVPALTVRSRSALAAPVVLA